MPAHITLFHHLPPSLLGELSSRLKRLCEGPPPAATLTEVMLLGGGVSYRVDSPDLLALRQQLTDSFLGLLIPQDKGQPRLHITIQNKVAAAEARALAELLRADFRRRPLSIAGLAAWRYRGGPWELAMKASFRGSG